MGALAAALSAIIQWLLSAVVSQAAKPSVGIDLSATPRDEADAHRLRDAARSFRGVRLVLLASACLLGGGCWGSRVYFAQPAIPVRLGQDVRGVRLFVRSPDGTWQEARGDLFAGQHVLTDPADWDDRAKVLRQGIVATGASADEVAP